MIRAIVLGLLLVSAIARAYDSRCYVAGDACHDGPQAARNRWIGPSDEHRQLWVETFNLSGVGTATMAPIDDFTLEVFAADDVVAEGTGRSIPTLTPVAFNEAERVHDDRTMSPGEFAQLPDFGYALWDWATGFETCPLGISAPLDACHEFRTHMGAVNSNHFLPQAQAFYAYYHQLALGRAAACKTMKDRIAARGGQPAAFRSFLDACAQEAFVLEAVGHHFLQDAWSTGHMWERWGSPDLSDFTDLPQALLIAMTSGLIHGARGVLQDALGFAGFDVNDPLCAPGSLIRFIPGPITATVAGLGDLYLDQLLAQSGAAFPSQYLQLFSCAATSLRQVARALGDEPGPIDAALIEVDDPTGSACFAQRVTNAAMREGMGIDMTTPGGVPVRIELDSAQAMALVPAASAAVGGSLQNVNPIINAQYDFDVARMVTRARLQALLHPDATNLASGGLPPLLGIGKNSAFVRQPLATYVDPPLPWPSSNSGANDAATRSLALARTFHAAHAIDWCNRFRTGAPDDLEGLRAHVHVLQAASIGGEDLEAACRACGTFVARALRVGTSENDYDHTREPLCFHVADDPASVQYVYRPGMPADDRDTLARGFCDCSCPVVFDGTVTDNTDQTDFTDQFNQTRHGFEHDTYDVHLVANADGTFSASGPFTTDTLDAFSFDGDPGERCTATTTRHGTGVVTSFSGRLSDPDGFLEATATVMETFVRSPCKGEPGSMDTSSSERSFHVSPGDMAPPTFSAGCLTAINWDFFFFDPASNTTDRTTGSVTGTP